MDQKDFLSLARYGQQLAKQAVGIYSVLVDEIISGQRTDKREIEEILDGMLGFCFDPEMLLIFKKLCRYFYDIDPESTVFYVNYYREMWDNEDTNSSVSEKLT